MLDFKFGVDSIIEYEILTEPETKRLIDTVMDAITGAVQIDYEMRGEWVQLKPKTIIDRVKLKAYDDGWKSVGLRDVKSKTPEIKPPQAIVRHRRKAWRKVYRALDKLAAHDIVTKFTLRANGYLHVEWFDGWVETERVSFEHWNTGHDPEFIAIDDDRMAMEYLRDRIFLSPNDYIRNIVKED